MSCRKGFQGHLFRSRLFPTDNFEKIIFGKGAVTAKPINANTGQRWEVFCLPGCKRTHSHTSSVSCICAIQIFACTLLNTKPHLCLDFCEINMDITDKIL